MIDIVTGLLMGVAILSGCTEDGARAADAARTQQAQRAPQTSDRTIVIPSGTMISASLDTYLTTETTLAGDRFTATALEPIVIGGRLVVPTGASVHGIVRNVQQSGRIDGRAEMTLAFQEIEDVEGKRHAISALPLTLQADSERRSTPAVGGGPDTAIRDAVSGRTETALGAGAGAVLVVANQGDFIELEVGRRMYVRMRGPTMLTLAAVQ